ncbi:MAG: peptidoglycan DD-metalloendopeptidase family protein [Gammaproteobacteria bacterium]|nr:peptidoglycan DD-metalloendopeptidase family protein [Gammaproteobacteria bacterium]
MPALCMAALCLVLLAGCGAHVYHRVEPGETLYSIGWIYGYDYRQIAEWNDIPAPYVLTPGRELRLAPPSGHAPAPLAEYREAGPQTEAENATLNRRTNRTPAPVVESTRATAKVIERSTAAQGGSDNETGNETGNRADDGLGAEAQNVITSAKTAINRLFDTQAAATSPQLTWQWPVKERRVLRTFSAKDPSRQGLDFAGEKGQPVLAAAAGRVVYAGSGLVRHGRLIIIKHNEKYLSAYAHNQKLHVKEGESVSAGQRIADMGRTGHIGEALGSGTRAKLHFEIRRNGEPVNPSQYLPQ